MSDTCDESGVGVGVGWGRRAWSWKDFFGP